MVIRSEPARDPCVAIQGEIELHPGEEREIVFLLGQTGRGGRCSRLAALRYREPGAVAQAFKEVKDFWDNVLSTVQVRTPDPGMDLLLNRWLLYQVLELPASGAGRLSISPSGAFGFRDQLQDVMALVYAAPHVARAHILRSASTAISGRRRAALVASARRRRRADAHLRRLSVAAVRRRCTMSPHRRSRPCSTSRRRSWKRRCCGPNRRKITACRTSPRKRRRSTNTASGPWSMAAVRRPRIAADGNRRLERRHEPGRRAAAKAKASGRLVPADDAARLSPTWRKSAATATRAALRESGKRCGEGCEEHAWDGPGIAGPISTTARRSARRKTTNAASTRLPNRGR